MRLVTLIIAISFFATNLIAQQNDNSRIGLTAKEEFRVKREEIFEFAQKPQITREGNNFNIAFETKGFCDVTIAIENADGKIVRHLISGVLGPKAPAPFQKNSKAQVIVWDGKNDQEIYVKDSDREECTIRVSLGLKPQMERTLFWSPKKRVGNFYPVFCSAPEGIYVAESFGIDQVRLFDHQGNYVRTIYPFPSDKLEKVGGLKMHNFIQDGKAKPLKRGYLQSTLLTTIDEGYNSQSITSIAATKGHVLVAGLHLNRLPTDGSAATQQFYGPQVAIPVVNSKDQILSPNSMAISPDGKWVYLADYTFSWPYNPPTVLWMNAVTKMPFDGSAPPTVFAGDMTQGKSSKEEGFFRMPTCVACDASGRVYVSDYMNDRIQVFSPEGKVLKIIPITKPAYINIHQKTGDIYVFTFLRVERGYDPTPNPENSMTHLGPFDNPIVKNKCPLPTLNPGDFFWREHFKYTIEFDSWAEKPTIWLLNGNTGGISRADDGSVGNPRLSSDDPCAILYEEEQGKLVLKTQFINDVKKSVTRINPPVLWRQRLAVNPATEKLYVLEGDSGVMKSVNQLVEISPDTGAIKLVDLPMGAEDLCFDQNGLIYLRTDSMIGRYDPTTWKEIPFDYGIEMENHSYGMGAKAGNMVSGLQTPGHRSFSFWHLGGIDVSVKGHIAVTTCNGFEMGSTPQWTPGEAHIKIDGKPYKPGVYSGRMRWGEIHIWDKYGKIIKEDAVPGMGHLNGIGIDQDDNIYMLTSAKRIIDGKQTDPEMGNDSSGTVLKVTANKNKFYSSGKGIPVPLPDAEQPKRSIDIAGMTTGWAEGAEWLYGGIGLSKPGSCVCWNSRFSKDYFNRSFAPEIQNFSIAVIDSNGNLILRVGKYGNVEDGKPLIADGGPKETRSIGGDEVGLFYACYVASDTDRRLFIADAGNTRILSVKLGYNTEEKTPIKKITEKK